MPPWCRILARDRRRNNFAGLLSSHSHDISIIVSLPWNALGLIDIHASHIVIAARCMKPVKWIVLRS